VLEAVQQRLDENPQAMRVRREAVEHLFGTLKMRMGATHFLMKRLPKVATEMALHVLACNLTRVMNILGVEAPHRGDPDVRGAHRIGMRIGASLTPDRANHVDSSSQLRQHAKLSLASPVSLGRNVFTRPRPRADIYSPPIEMANSPSKPRHALQAGEHPALDKICPAKTAQLPKHERWRTRKRQKD
jgi:hypothetical protein